MSDPIKAGDLVMIVRGHSCVLNAYGGIPYTVTKIAPPDDRPFTCQRCNALSGDESGAVLHAFKSAIVPLSWLLKIDPPAIPETVETSEGIPA